ncbi:phosphotransferase [Candidatus Falkowbacteria bacterium]|nr:phosphotransferase [Candidatus Falkowbacteria bacterium]
MGLEDNLRKLFADRQKQVEADADINQGVGDKKKNEELIAATNTSANKLIRMKSVFEQVKFAAQVEDTLRGLGMEWNERDLGRMIESETEERHLNLPVLGPDLEPKFFKAYRGGRMNKEDVNHHRNAFIREVSVSRLLKDKLGIEAFGVSATNVPAGPIDPEDNNPDNKTFYALIESAPADGSPGFIRGHEQMAQLTAEQGRQAIKELVGLGRATAASGLKLEEEIHDAQDHFDGFDGYEENTKKIMSMFEFEEETDEKYENYVTPADHQAIGEYLKSKHPQEYAALVKDIDEDKVEADRYPFWAVLEYRLSKQQGKPVDFRQAVGKLFEKLKPTVGAERNVGEYMTHGDLSPNNLYVGQQDKTVFTDWEWAGWSGNRLLAIAYDYGNLRARAWNNTEYREALDAQLLEELGEEDGRAAMSMGILRSHANLAGFFENYDIGKQLEEEEKKRREATEQDIAKAFASMDVAI